MSQPSTSLASTPVEAAEASSDDVPAIHVPPTKSSLADWTATASDDEWANLERQPRQRGGRKKRKKNRDTQEVTTNWDDIYDPSRPNNYEEYKNSEEKVREVQEWKDLLYRHRMRRPQTSGEESDTSAQRPRNSALLPQNCSVRDTNLGGVEDYAPLPSFAPPSNLNDEHVPPSPPPPPPNDLPDDPTGEAAYLRRLGMSQPQPIPPPPPPNELPLPQISRAPVRYNFPPAPEELPSDEAELEALAQREPEDAEETTEDQPRSNRPGQKGFAERLLSKYGWSKGQGLGAQGTGIINPLYAKIDKRKKKSDAEGGGFATPVATAKIMGGNKSKTGQTEDLGKFGAMSEVVRLQGMLNGMDLDAEISGEEGGIMQEIGEECSEKYGTVERVYIHRDESFDDGPLVFVAFVSQLSALRAVNALEGRVFNGNAIKARFWPTDSFTAASYV